jgi:hypothetical protein
MLKEALQYLISMGELEDREYDGVDFTSGLVKHVEVPVLPVIHTRTLMGIVDYYKMLQKKSIEDAKNLIVHVESPRGVSLLIWHGDNQNRKRQYHVKAETKMNGFNFGDFMGQEEFIIGLNANFVQNESLAELIKSASLIKSVVEAEEHDDGISQTAIMKKGAALNKSEKIKTIVVLQPISTFNEVEQPECEFVFRLRGVDDEPATMALFNVENMAVDRLGMDNVAKWLRAELGKEIPIIS